MKRLLLVALLAIVTAGGAQAQDNPAIPSQANLNVVADLANTSAAAKVPDGFPWAPSGSPPNSTSLAERATLAQPAEASAAAAPAPKFAYGSRDDYRWQLGLGISLVRFRSSQFYATGVGTNTSITYFTNDWFAVEGAANTAFAPTIYHDDHVKFFSYGAGPRIAWRARKWEPWAHVIGGGMHILPQTAGHSQNGLAFNIGGGVDYRFYPHLSLRAEVDWIKTHVFDEWGNSAQANLDIVLHF
jgi:opacity protein-like surface antigen